MLTHKQPQKYIALRNVLVDRVKRVSRQLTRSFSSDGALKASGMEEFGALSDVSFKERC
jgi:hypothetical protein